jgi:hypothetical protein
LEIAPKTKARDFHIPTATGPSLSLKVRPGAGLGAGSKGVVLPKCITEPQKRRRPTKKYLTGIAVSEMRYPITRQKLLVALGDGLYSGAAL